MDINSLNEKINIWSTGKFLEVWVIRSDQYFGVAIFETERFHNFNSLWMFDLTGSVR